MKWTRSKRVKGPIKKWHKWFAWYPVQVSEVEIESTFAKTVEKKYVFCEYVWRKGWTGASGWIHYNYKEMSSSEKEQLK